MSFTCPYRIASGPWGLSTNIDSWGECRWTTDEEEAKRLRQAWLERSPTNAMYESSYDWFWSWGPPRTCSFCSSIHGEDAIRLIEEEWEIEACDSRDKAYLNPPGTSQSRAVFLRNLRLSKGGPVMRPSVWAPMPQVKLKFEHLDKAQLRVVQKVLR